MHISGANFIPRWQICMQDRFSHLRLFYVHLGITAFRFYKLHIFSSKRYMVSIYHFSFCLGFDDAMGSASVRVPTYKL